MSVSRWIFIRAISAIDHGIAEFRADSSRANPAVHRDRRLQQWLDTRPYKDSELVYQQWNRRNRQPDGIGNW
jgi:hypothetical protein